MAPILLLLLLLFTTPSLISPQSPPSKITPGSSLSTNSTSWSSPSGRFNFGFYPERNGFKVGIWIAEIPKTTVIWTAIRDDPPVSDGAIIRFTDDGRLLLSTIDGQQKLISNPSPSSSSGSWASLLDSGNLVLYNTTSQIIWQSFDFPTDTIVSGQRLSTGKFLYSGAVKNNHSTGRFQLAMQVDGNLVQYTLGNPYWSSQTPQLGFGISLELNNDGYLALLDPTGSNVRNLTVSGDKRLLYRATLDVDGVFRLYSHSVTNTTSVTVWSSILDPCLGGGFCGYNSYCAIVDKEQSIPTCHCLDGFDFLDMELRFEGCKANFSEQDCSVNDGNISYSISILENTTWVDASYLKFDIGNEDGCKQDCMADCNCHMATFKNGTCSKFFLPFKFGRKGNDSTKSFIKVGKYNASAIIPKDPSQKKVGRFYKMLFMVGMVITSCLFVIVSLLALQIMVDRSRIRRCRDFISYRVTNNVNLRSFKYRELNEATNGFKDVLGRGSFGCVFRGTLFGDFQIAVKRLDKVREEGERQFHTEMNVIAKTHHRNLIHLLGYCDEGSHRLLVYEFMSNGSLADLLFNGERRPNWEDRVRMSMEIAMGLFYLHEECDTQIIHCDIKPHNILLDGSWNAKISDFGLSKLLDNDQTRTLTGARGTRGYAAPEWNRHVPINVKVDVYSFGVMLLEIICCRKSFKADAPGNEILLSDWVYECFHGGKLQNLIAPEELESRTERRRLERMVMVGLWCIQEVPSLRPSMKRVVIMLEGMVDIQAPPRPMAPIVDGNPMAFEQ